MVARGRGGVLNVSSVEGFMPVPYQAAYAATKAFVLSLSRALNYELSGSGVRLSVLAPGATDTRIHALGGAQHAYYVSLFPVMTSEDVARIAYRQFQRGKAVIVPGWLNRFYAVVQRFVRPARAGHEVLGQLRQALRHRVGKLGVGVAEDLERRAIVGREHRLEEVRDRMAAEVG